MVKVFFTFAEVGKGPRAALMEMAPRAGDAVRFTENVGSYVVTRVEIHVTGAETVVADGQVPQGEMSVFCFVDNA
jgi:hypothetical protein